MVQIKFTENRVKEIMILTNIFRDEYRHLVVFGRVQAFTRISFSDAKQKSVFYQLLTLPNNTNADGKQIVVYIQFDGYKNYFPVE